MSFPVKRPVWRVTDDPEMKISEKFLDEFSMICQYVLRRIPIKIFLRPRRSKSLHQGLQTRSYWCSCWRNLQKIRCRQLWHPWQGRMQKTRHWYETSRIEISVSLENKFSFPIFEVTRGQRRSSFHEIKRSADQFKIGKRSGLSRSNSDLAVKISNLFEFSISKNKFFFTIGTKMITINPQGNFRREIG